MEVTCLAAVLRKADGEAEETDIPKGEKLPKAFTEFAKALDITLPAGKAVLFGQSLYWAPKRCPISVEFGCCARGWSWEK